jgi:hypothetical protein
MGVPSRRYPLRQMGLRFHGKLYARGEKPAFRLGICLKLYRPAKKEGGGR